MPKNRHKNRLSIVQWGLVLCLSSAVARFVFFRPVASETQASPVQEAPPRSFKILHVMSYHTPWEWTETQFNGFKEALRGLDVTYQVVEMDANRNNNKEWIRQISQKALDLIETWKPDLLFTSDDAAQSYVALRYLNTKLPIVFSGVNGEPLDYGFDHARNVTGVLERMHFVQTLNLLKSLVPSVRSVAIITDPGLMWDPLIQQCKVKEGQLDGIQVVAYEMVDTYSEFQRTVLDYQDRVDALGFLGIFEFKNVNGDNVSQEIVQNWVAENSRLPDFSFWKDRVGRGTLCAVTVSGTAQGQAAGEIARGILVEGRRPTDYPIKTTETGIPIINLARAFQLGIMPKADVLLTAEVIKEITP